VANTKLALALGGRAGERGGSYALLLAHRDGDLAQPPPLEGEAVRRILARWEPDASVEVAGRLQAGAPPPRSRAHHRGHHLPSRPGPSCSRAALVSLLARTDYERSAWPGRQRPRDTRTLELLAGLGRRDRVRVLHDARSFNFAALNNAAARQLETPTYWCFSTTTTEIVDFQTDHPAARRGAAPRGRRRRNRMLLYPDGTVQHAGVALGNARLRRPPVRRPGARIADAVRCSRGGHLRNWLAVTAGLPDGPTVQVRTGSGGFDESFVGRGQ